jgi:hypothetical protein
MRTVCDRTTLSATQSGSNPVKSVGGPQRSTNRHEAINHLLTGAMPSTPIYVSSSPLQSMLKAQNYRRGSYLSRKRNVIERGRDKINIKENRGEDTQLNSMARVRLLHIIGDRRIAVECCLTRRLQDSDGTQC